MSSHRTPKADAHHDALPGILRTTHGMTHNDLVKEIRSSAERLIEASSTLIVVHSFAASAEMVCRGIEMVAGYFAGSAARTPSRGNFLRFAEHYLPDLGKTSPGDLALVGPPYRLLATCAEAVHAAWQGGLFHDGERPTGIRVVDDKGRWMLSFLADGSARLNAIPFQSQFERGLKSYLGGLVRDPELAARAVRRSAFLARPAFAHGDG